MERKLEEQLSQQEVAQQERALASWQQWASSGPGVLKEPEEADSDQHISSILQQALSKGQQMLECHQQR